MPPLLRNSSAVTTATAAYCSKYSSPSDASSESQADSRNNSVRRPPWSPSQAQAYGATTRVQFCSEANAPIASVE